MGCGPCPVPISNKKSSCGHHIDKWTLEGSVQIPGDPSSSPLNSNPIRHRATVISMNWAISHPSGAEGNNIGITDFLSSAFVGVGNLTVETVNFTVNYY